MVVSVGEIPGAKMPATCRDNARVGRAMQSASALPATLKSSNRQTPETYK